jgi:DNA topoisomerase II
LCAGVSGKARDCTLIITEGESAKALAIAGLEVVGRENYGVISLKGKVMNVSNRSRDAFKSEEILKLLQAMGLEYSRDYATQKEMGTLRYGHIMLMTDQDADGAHIKGLIINILNTYWPLLLQKQGFIQQLCTPLVKVIKKGENSSSLQVVKEFYSNEEFENWRAEQMKSEETRKKLMKCSVKYYKVCTCVDLIFRLHH